MPNQFISQESLVDTTEPHSRSLLVSRNAVFEYSLPDRRATSLDLPSNHVSSTGSQRAGAMNSKAGSILNTAPPFFLLKNTRASSGPQASSVECSQTESIKPSHDTILATLQDNLHRTNKDKKVDAPESDSNFSSPTANKHSLADQSHMMEQQCPPSPLNKIRSRYLARTPSQVSQCSTSTVKANSSGSNSPASSEVWETPQSSPLLTTRRGKAAVCSQPTECTEASISEHRETSEDWQTHSIKSHIQGTSYIVSGSSSEYPTQRLSSQPGKFL